VFEHRIDNIVGIAYAMDMLDYVEQVELLQRLTVGRIAHRPAYFVPGECLWLSRRFSDGEPQHPTHFWRYCVI
jgi:Mg2+/Co2+ transporter CorB